MDRSLSVELVTLGFMMFSTMLTVVAGWVKSNERIARLEASVEFLVKQQQNRREKGDVETH